jgi:hypothetical protein
MRNAMVKRRDMGRNTRTLHIVTELVEIPMMMSNMISATAYSVTTETICSYCKQKNHTIEMCMNRKFDRELKDKVFIIVTTFVKNYKTLNDPLQQKGRLSNDLEKIVRTTIFSRSFESLPFCRRSRPFKD